MKNITVTVEDEVYLAARQRAAERNTSVSRLVSEFLRSLSREDDLRADRIRQLEAAFHDLDQRPPHAPVGRFQRTELYDAELC